MSVLLYVLELLCFNRFVLELLQQACVVIALKVCVIALAGLCCNCFNRFVL